VLCDVLADMTSLSPCTHEEADTRLFLHAADVVRDGCKRVLIRSVDTDVVVLAVAKFKEAEAEEIWIAFGTGANFRCIAVHDIAVSLNPRKCTRLPMFHTFTGCDTVSVFAGRGKKTAWEAWNVYCDVTEAFEQLMSEVNGTT